MTDKPVSIEELREELKAKGYEGLYCTDERCGCGLDYLVACGEPLDGDEGILEICKPAYKHTCIGGECAYPCDGYLPGREGDCYGPSKDGQKRRELEVDMYAEPGKSTLRKLVKDDPEWAVSRLCAEREHVTALTAKVEELSPQYEVFTAADGEPATRMVDWRQRAEQAEAALAAERERAEMWEWVARHEFVCPLGEMNPGEAGSYVVERGVHDALVARYAARPAPEEETP